MQQAENTYIFDVESATELARLMSLDRLTTQTMGGPLVGLADPSTLRAVMDMGCGPGGWVLDTAFALPHAQVEGVDLSRSMVDYANARARTQHLTNASFGVMDITHPFEFPDASYDLVNARYLVAVLKKEVWPAFLAECHRILRPGGWLRLTEPSDFGMTNSQAVNELMDLLLLTLSQEGYEVSKRSPTILPMLKNWLRTHAYEHVHHIAHELDYSIDQPAAWADTYRMIEILGEQIKPLILKGGRDVQDFEHLQQQVLIDLNQEAFTGLSHWTTLIGQKSFPPSPARRKRRQEQHREMTSRMSLEEQ